MRGGGGKGVQSTGARHVLRGPSRGPTLIKFFFRDTSREMLDKLRLRMLRSMSSMESRGEGVMSPQ